MTKNFFLMTVLLFSFSTFATSDKNYTIYHDADYSLNLSSAKAMKMGLLTAFSEVNYEVQGYRFEFKEKNHRGNIKRSLMHMKSFIEDEKALFILGGLHSPPYIKNRAFINENQIPLFVPWAAGGPITRYPSEKNWVFRLSVDDAKAGIRISEFALNKLSCLKPHLLLEDTPWGKSNQRTMSSYLTNKVPYTVSWFGWNTKQNTARMILRNVLANNTDCLFLVANFNESNQFIQAMLSIKKEHRIPIVSHWGVTGGDVDAIFNEEVRNAISFSFIQSCFSFTADGNTSLHQAVLEKANKLFPNDISLSEQPKAPAGFIHAYDLGKIIISALQQIEITGEVKQDRLLLRNALENLERPVQGFIKTYIKPFSPWMNNRPDAHEALGLEDFCMAEFGLNNTIKVKSN